MSPNIPPTNKDAEHNNQINGTAYFNFINKHIINNIPPDRNSSKGISLLRSRKNIFFLTIFFDINISYILTIIKATTKKISRDINNCSDR